MKRRVIAACALMISAAISAASDSETAATQARAILAQQWLFRSALADLSMASGKQFMAGAQAHDPYLKRLPAHNNPAERLTAPQRLRFGFQLIPVNRLPLLLPYRSGPAFDAGIRHAVWLRSINGRPAAAGRMHQYQALAASTDRLTLQISERSHATAAVRSLTIQARPRVYPAVERYIAGELEVWRIHRFVAHRIRQLLRQREQDPAPPKLLIDLRYNSGGALFEAMDAASLFVPRRSILGHTVDAAGHRQTYRSFSEHTTGNERIVILTSRQTASAAEVFAAALQHHRVAHIVGEQTYGKCLSQTLKPLADGSLLRFSNLRIIWANGHYCAGHGLQPDQRLSPVLTRPTKELLAGDLL